MKLFGRSGGYYLFWASAIYLTVGFFNIFVYHFVREEIIQILWIAALAFPFTCPPFGRWLNLSVTWDKDMFNWFGKKDKEQSNVIKFPEPKEVPYVEPPKKEEPAKVYYRLGLTDNNRVAFYMGYTEITMNKLGTQQMIDQLTFYMSQLSEDDLDSAE